MTMFNISRLTPPTSIAAEADNAHNALRLLLDAVAQSQTKSEFLRIILRILKDLTGCRAVGIRVLDDQGNIPYVACDGFCTLFWNQENWLNTSQHTCACIRAVTQQFEPQDYPALTAKGSFYLGDAPEYVSGLSEIQRERFRGTCIDFGYRTILVTPILTAGQVVGAIHAADSFPNKVSKAVVSSVEYLAPVIGQAIKAYTYENDLARHDERVETFIHIASSLAHEIRNPLTTVKGFAQLLGGTQHYDRATMEKFLAIINSEVDQANEVIKKVLEVAEPHPEPLKPCSISGIIRDVLSTYEKQESGPQITIQTELEPETPECLLRRSQFVRVVTLMVNNAIDAMPEGGRLTLRCGISPAKEAVWVQIEDSGQGITPENMRRLGVPFFTTKDTGETLGLNLSLCYAIIREHRGWIEVDSTRGVGTTFTLFLPCSGNSMARPPRPRGI